MNYYKIGNLSKKVFLKLQARKDFLKISKPAEIWWGTPFVRNNSWGTLQGTQDNQRVSDYPRYTTQLKSKFLKGETTPSKSTTSFYDLNSKNSSIYKNTLIVGLETNAGPRPKLFGSGG